MKGTGAALRRPAPFRRPFVSWSSSPWPSSRPRRHAATTNSAGRSAGCCDRAACPIGSARGPPSGRRAVVARSGRRRHPRRRRRRAWPPSSGCAPAHHDAGDLRRRPGDRSRADPPGDARRRQRVLHVAGAGRLVPGRGAAHGARAARARTRTAKPPSVDAGLLRRQGRRRHDDRRRQLRGGARAADQAPDGDRRPQARLRRGRAVPRRAPAVHRARRAREPAPARQGLPARAAARSTSRASRFWPAPSSSSGRAPGRRRRSKSCSACSASRTTTSSSTPATRSTRAASPRSTRPTRSSSSPTPTCRRCATRSGWSTACGSSASAASGSASC